MEQIAAVRARVDLTDVGRETDATLLRAVLNDLFQACERTTADEKNVRRINSRELLVRMLAPALRRHIRDRAFQYLQQRLLHAFARNVARDRRILVLAANLVDLVDVDDPTLCPRHITFGSLQQLQDDVLDIFAHVSGFSQCGCVHDGEWHIQHLCQGLRQQRFA